MKKVKGYFGYLKIKHIKKGIIIEKITDVFLDFDYAESALFDLIDEYKEKKEYSISIKTVYSIHINFN